MFTLVEKLVVTALCVYDSWFANSINHEGKSQAFEKSRLVVEACNDNDHGFLTHNFTVQHVSQRLLLVLHVMDSGVI